MFLRQATRGTYQALNSRFYTFADAQAQATTPLPRQRNRTYSLHSGIGYSLRKLTVADKDRVKDFVNRFYRDEPLTVAVNLMETPESRCKELEEHAAASLHYGVSIAAVDGKGDLVGVMLSDIVKRKDGIYNAVQHCPDLKFRRILQVLEHLERESCWWNFVPAICDTVLYMSLGAIHTDWRGRGVVTMFYKETERIAKKIGAGAMRLDCTSVFTAMAAEKLKYTKLIGVKYKDMPFAPQPAAPHDEASLYIKIL